MNKKCLYCNAPEVKSSDGFCSQTCKIKWQTKAEASLIKNGAIAISKDMSNEDKSLQLKFIKKLSKTKIREKLKISEGAI